LPTKLYPAGLLTGNEHVPVRN